MRSSRCAAPAAAAAAAAAAAVAVAAPPVGRRAVWSVGTHPQRTRLPEAQRVAQALREAGIIGDSAADTGKAVALFCSSEVGLTSMVRQLEPDLHIDGNVETLRCATRERFPIAPSRNSLPHPRWWRRALQATPLAKKTRMLHVGAARGAGLKPAVEHTTAVSAFLANAA
jgi:hypothetical protein